MVDQSTLNNIKNNLGLGDVAYSPTISSTNDTALEWIEAGCPNYSLIFADRQTKGKGRSGRTWYTLPQSALAFSFIITQPQQEISLLSGVAALAVHDAISRLIINDVAIKWPNDILVQNRKVCGVLLESQWSGSQLLGIVLGIGVNISSGSLNFSEEVRYPAAYLEMFTDSQVSRSALLKEIITRLIRWDKEAKPKEVIQTWNQRLAFMGEKVIAVRNEATSQAGTLLGVSSDGNILLELENGQTIEYTANEIQITV